MEWMALDARSVQNDSGSLRPSWPAAWAKRAGVEHRTQVTPVVHVPTGSVIFLAPDAVPADLGLDLPGSGSNSPATAAP